MEFERFKILAAAEVPEKTIGSGDLSVFRTKIEGGVCGLEEDARVLHTYCQHKESVLEMESCTMSRISAYLHVSRRRPPQHSHYESSLSENLVSRRTVAARTARSTCCLFFNILISTE